MDDGPTNRAHHVDDLAEQVAARVQAELGDPSEWADPGGYPDGLALCVIDSIQSIGVRYGTVVRVIDRYRALRRQQGADPAVDGAPELLSTFAALGGAELWAVRVGTANRTSTHAGAPLKAVAIKQAAEVLSTCQIHTCQDLRNANAKRLHQAKQSWIQVPGQRSGISWSYLLMLSGSPGVKPDRMIIRFVAAALDRSENDVTAKRAATIVIAVAGKLGVSVTRLDHAIWRWQSGRTN